MYFFKKRRWLVVIAFWLVVTSIMSSCSVQYKHRRSQSNDYNQCWCIDPMVGGAEWCCPGTPPKYMNPYAHGKGYNTIKGIF